MTHPFSHLVMALIFSLPLGYLNQSLAAENTLPFSKTTYGRAERVALPQGLILAARMDTGAETSSLHAINIQKFSKDGKEWVSFETQDPKTKKIYNFSLPVVGVTNIKSRAQEHNVNSKTIERYVVSMPICLEKQMHTVDVNLANRSHFTYPLLIGRKTMYAFHAVIDPTLIYTQTPSCEKI